MRHLLCLFVVILFCGGPVTAEEPTDADKSAIQQAIDAYVAGFDKGDAGVLAGLWTEQGELTTSLGEKWVGRQQLQSQFAKYFATVKDAKLELENTEIELQSPSVAVETGLARVIVPDAEPSETTYKAIHVKTAEGWRIDSIREQEVAPLPPSQYEKLKELEWMIGQWADTSEDAHIKTSCRWTTNQNFIVRMNYNDWWYRRAFIAVPVQNIVGKTLMTFRDFPPRQKPASFTIDQAMEALLKPGAPGK